MLNFKTIKLVVLRAELLVTFLLSCVRQSAALSSATQHAMPPEYGRKWGTCLNTRFPLPTLL